MKTETTTTEDIALVRERVARAKNIMVISGAGISAESGVPTFRDDRGLWREFNPLDYATREAFKRDPVKVWKWYDERRGNMAQARPNPGHLALAALEKPGRRVFVVTQNVDDLHEQAGSKEVVRIHGSLWHTRCERDGTVLENRETPLSEIPPLCMCGNVLRPDIVWFGENLPRQPVEQIHHYFLEGRIDLCFVIGTEASFGYILQWALLAHEAAAMLVDVNPRDTGLGSIVDVHFKEKAGELLPRLIS
ncbi:NAD-dependent deacylase [candidate division WOR-3 bacterium]|uniref:NAD-dependent protein deacylase n=1 Tax=candidate division WOR-3 bacterium TaxID=2052148 RepID=A0A938BS81_UNCW3|nr:NAD-dependent deacylase [candidate division WOR-3 bacterium]